MKIAQYCGDSKNYEIPLAWEGSAFTPGTSWYLLFTAKRSSRDEDADSVIQKTTGAGITVIGTTAQVEIVPADTAAHTPGDLVWDIQAQNNSTGEVRTVAEGRITLIRDITRLTRTSIPVYLSNPYPVTVNSSQIADATSTPEAGKVVLYAPGGVINALGLLAVDDSGAYPAWAALETTGIGIVRDQMSAFARWPQFDNGDDLVFGMFKTFATNADAIAAGLSNGNIYYSGVEFFVVGGASSSGSAAWADITGKPTTLAGYGITDAAAIAHSQAESTLTFSDITTNNASTTAHGFSPKATAPASGLLNVLGIANGETVRTDKALFDATVPAALGTAAAGTAMTAARRDHVHAVPDANTLAGTTLKSTIVTSSLTTVGTIGTGVWQGTVVGGQYGGTGVNNSGKTVTLGGNLTTTGAYNLTIAQAASVTMTLPGTSFTAARTDAAQTFAGVQTFSSPPVFSALGRVIAAKTSGDQTLTATAYNVISFDSVDQNIAGLYASNAFTCPSAGYVHVTCTIYFASGSPGYVTAGLGVNGTVTKRINKQTCYPDTQYNFSVLAKVAANDVLTIQLYPAAACVIGAGAAVTFCSFEMLP